MPKSPKWRDFLTKGNYPVYDGGQSPEYQALVIGQRQKLREKVDPTDVIALGKMLIRCKQLKEDAENAVKVANLRLEAVSQELRDSFEASGGSAVDTEDGRVGMHLSPKPVVKDKRKLFEWCHRNGLGDSMSLHYGKLLTTTKELLEDGQEPPDGVEVFTHKKFSVTGAK